METTKQPLFVLEQFKKDMIKEVLRQKSIAVENQDRSNHTMTRKLCRKEIDRFNKVLIRLGYNDFKY